eukprot:6977304-Prymnesium_polylepis.2
MLAAELEEASAHGRSGVGPAAAAAWQGVRWPDGPHGQLGHLLGQRRAVCPLARSPGELGLAHPDGLSRIARSGPVDAYADRRARSEREAWRSRRHSPKAVSLRCMGQNDLLPCCALSPPKAHGRRAGRNVGQRLRSRLAQRETAGGAARRRRQRSHPPLLLRQAGNRHAHRRGQGECI